MAPIVNVAGIIEPCLQMPHIESCLTRKLYFMPGCHGNKGSDWDMEVKHGTVTTV